MKFESMPRIVRSLIVLVIGSKQYFLRYGPAYRQFRGFLKSSERWSLAEREAWLTDSLKKLVTAAIDGTVYYKTLDLSGVQAASGLRETLAAIPPLDKDTLRSRSPDFFNTAVSPVATSRTSGSTGSPMIVEYDRGSIQRRFALLAEHRAMAGIGPSDRGVRLSGRIICEPGKPHRRPWLHNPLEKQLLLSTYHLDARHFPAIRRKLEAFRPALIDGYPSAILSLMRLYRAHGAPLPAGLKAIITTAETLDPGTREELEQLSGVGVFDYYSASEGAPIIQQCAFGTYHARWQSGIFEVEDDGVIAGEGDGALVVTSFVQDRTLLIRYRTGDHVHSLKLASGACGCGLVTPTVADVLGRAEDLITTTDGRTLGMFSYRTLKYVDGLIEAQIVQNSVDGFLLRAVRDPRIAKEDLVQDARRNMERVLGYPIQLEYEEVSVLLRGKNNKLRSTISHVKPAGAGAPPPGC